MKFLINTVVIVLLVNPTSAQNQFGEWIFGPNGWYVQTNLTTMLENMSTKKNTMLEGIEAYQLFDIQNVVSANIYLHDFNQDGYKEYIVSCKHTDLSSKIHVFDSLGISLTGFPFTLPRNPLYVPKFSVYDDNKMVISYIYNQKGYFLGINSSGQQVIPEFEIGGTIYDITKEPVVADITGDGKEEIILLYAHGLTFQSKLVFFNPAEIQIIQEIYLPYSQMTPAIGDIDGDGINDVIHETGVFFDDNVTIWVFQGNGNIMPGWPKLISRPTTFSGVHLADFTGDSRSEIILCLIEYTVPNTSHVKLISPDGVELYDHTFQFFNEEIPHTALGKEYEVRGASNPPIIIAGRGHYIHFTNLFNDSTQSIQLEYFPNDLKAFRTMPDSITLSTELFTVATQIHNGNSKVNIIDKNRQIIKQVPITPAIDVQVSDLNNNGFLDIVYTNNISNEYSVFIIPEFHPYNPDKIEWPMFKHDRGKTCNYDFEDDFVPVELVSFNASVINNNVQLNWSTATEINNSGFEIHKLAQNDNEWSKIGFVPGFGTTTEPKSYSFTDENVSTGTYKYRLKQIDFDGSFEYSNEIEVVVDFTPKEFVLFKNYPNPFNPTTKIKYTIPSVTLRQAQSDILVTLKVYDVLGNEVATLVNEEKQSGVYEVEFDASSFVSGMYLYRIQSGEFIQTKKMILIK